MNTQFEIDGEIQDKGNVLASLTFKDMFLYLNLPSWIEERNVYNIKTNEIIGTIKPKKYNGLSYIIFDFDGEFAKIKTDSYGYVLVKLTKSLIISNINLYERGNY